MAACRAAVSSVVQSPLAPYLRTLTHGPAVMMSVNFPVLAAVAPIGPGDAQFTESTVRRFARSSVAVRPAPVPSLGRCGWSRMLSDMAFVTVW